MIHSNGNNCGLLFRTVTCVQRQCRSEQNNRHVQHLKKNMNKVTRCQQRWECFLTMCTQISHMPITFCCHYLPVGFAPKRKDVSVFISCVHIIILSHAQDFLSEPAFTESNCAIAKFNICTHVKKHQKKHSQTLAAIPLSGHKKILHALLGMGSIVGRR